MSECFGFVAECRVCKGAVEAAAALCNAIASSNSFVSLTGYELDPELKPNPLGILVHRVLTVNCKHCNGTRKTLTSEGKELMKMITRHLELKE